MKELKILIVLMWNIWVINGTPQILSCFCLHHTQRLVSGAILRLQLCHFFLDLRSKKRDCQTFSCLHAVGCVYKICSVDPENFSKRSKIVCWQLLQKSYYLCNWLVIFGIEHLFKVKWKIRFIPMWDKNINHGFKKSPQVLNNSKKCVQVSSATSLMKKMCAWHVRKQ